LARKTPKTSRRAGYFAASKRCHLASRALCGHCGDARRLNSIGQSLYEGLHFLATLFGSLPVADGLIAPHPRSPTERTRRVRGAGASLAPMYLQRAEGHNFHVRRAL